MSKAESSDETKLNVTQWMSIMAGLSGLLMGGGALGMQQTAPEAMVTDADVEVAVSKAVATKADRAELDKKVDVDDLHRLETSVNKLADTVISLTIEVRTKRRDD